MSAFVAGATIMAAGAGYSAYQAHESRKDAKREQQRIKDEEKKKQDALDAEIAAEKKAANLKAAERMRRKGYAGTVLGGKAQETPSLLGSVG